jgi:hypothetical protein
LLQVLETVGQIGLTPFVIKFRFAAQSRENPWLAQSVNPNF